MVLLLRMMMLLDLLRGLAVWGADALGTALLHDATLVGTTLGPVTAVETGPAVHAVVERVHEEDLHVGDVTLAKPQPGARVAAALPGDVPREQLVALAGALHPPQPAGTGFRVINNAN